MLFFVGCKDALVKPIRYKGGDLHPQPSKYIFPDTSNYRLHQQVSSVVKTILDREAKDIMGRQAITGLSAAMFIPNQGIWQIDTGFISKPNNVLIDHLSVFYWASVAKLVTSTVVYQLVAEQKLKLSSPLQNWYPNIQNSNQITIEHLLNHTNGIYSFNSDSSLHFSQQLHSPTELLNIALSKESLFQPGEYWAYTNTGYLLLALIVEQIENKSFQEIVKDRIARPEQLSSLRVLNLGELPNNLALAHYNNTTITTEYSVPLGAGNIVANSKDMVLFFYALLVGKYLPIETVHGMLANLYPMFNDGMYYGNGIMLYDFDKINGSSQEWIGHSGGTENYKAVLAYDTNTGVICAVSVNQNISAEAIAFILMKAL